MWKSLSYICTKKQRSFGEGSWLFSSELGVSSRKDLAGHWTAKLGIVLWTQFLFPEAIPGWTDLLNWVSFQMGVFFLIANFLPFISRNYSHFSGSLWSWFGWLMSLPSNKPLVSFFMTLLLLLWSCFSLLSPFSVRSHWEPLPLGHCVLL